MKLDRIIGILVVLVSVSSVLAWCKISIGNTAIWWAIDSAILLFFYKMWDRKQFDVSIVNCFLILVLCSAVYGLLLRAEVYWDYKLLFNNLMVFMLPLAAYAFMKPSLLTTTMRSYLTFSPWLLLLLSPFIDSDAYGRFLVPYSFMALFFKGLSVRNKILVFGAFCVTLLWGSESRSDVLKFCLCILLAVSFYYKKVETVLFRSIKFARVAFLILPFVFFTLAATDTFNIFKIDEELGIDGKYSMRDGNTGGDISALADTRTFLYVEEITSAIRNNYVVFGNSISRGYESAYFGGDADFEFKINRGERQSCEVSILNIFNYFGLVGCIIYFLIFSMASYNAIYKSKNRYVPIIGLYVAFRWTFGWIEDFSKFDLNYLFLWIMIGICFSPIFRNMTDSDFGLWVNKLNRR